MKTETERKWMITIRKSSRKFNANKTHQIANNYLLFDLFFKIS